MKKRAMVTMAALMTVLMGATAFGEEYTVKTGDSLWKISKERLGSGDNWGKLFAVNRHMIKNPDIIYAGQRLVMPDGVSAITAEVDDYVIELDPQYNVTTDELLKSFPIYLSDAGGHRIL